MSDNRKMEDKLNSAMASLATIGREAVRWGNKPNDVERAAFIHFVIGYLASDVPECRDFIDANLAARDARAAAVEKGRPDV